MNEIWSKMFTGLYVKYRCYSCQILTKHEFSRQIFEKISYIKFNENLSSWSRVVARGQRDIHEEDNIRVS
jgi:hypothetical protein